MQKTAKDLLEIWRPHRGPQTKFLLTQVFELLYGGQAGGGKSVGLVAAGALQIHKRDYKGILFRKTYKQLEEPGGLVNRTQDLYPSLGGRYKSGDFRWYFPSGAEMVMRHLQHRGAKYNYQGAEYGFVGFDQLEQFGEDEYLYLFSRARTVNPGIHPYVRNTANPGAEWVLRRWLPWLGTDDELSQRGWPRAKSGEILYFKKEGDEDVLTDAEDPDGLSRTFIPASVYDNPTLMKNDPDYIKRLKALPYVDRRRLLDGDWHIKEIGGNVYNREWFTEFRDSIPPMLHLVRGFDLAGSEKETVSDDPDYTATVLMGEAQDHLLWFLDVHQDRLSPMKVENLIKYYHDTDPLTVVFAFEQEPGQSGKKQAMDLKLLCRGRRVVIVHRKTDKVSRSGALSSDVEGGLTVVYKAPWNGMFLSHMVNFPDPSWHDDIPDAAQTAHEVLSTRPGRAKIRAIEL